MVTDALVTRSLLAQRAWPMISSTLHAPMQRRRQPPDELVIADQELPSFTQVSFRQCAVTHPGGLPSNEDACAVVESPNASALVIADGAGGHAYGEVASELVVRHVATSLQKLGAYEPTGAIVEKALRGAQEELRKAITGSAKYYDMRSTGLLILATRAKIWVGHVGDSRAYLIRDGKAEQITRDDTLVQTLVDIGQLDKEAAKKHSKSNVLLQSLGDSRDIEFHVSEPIEIRVGDVLVACSDGLSDVIADDDLPGLTKDGTSREIAKRLLDTAVANGARDNVTVGVIVWRKSAGKKPSRMSISAQGKKSATTRKRKAAKSRDRFMFIAMLSVAITVMALAVAVKYQRTHRSGPAPAVAPHR